MCGGYWEGDIARYRFWPHVVWFCEFPFPALHDVIEAESLEAADLVKSNISDLDPVLWHNTSEETH